MGFKFLFRAWGVVGLSQEGQPTLLGSAFSAELVDAPRELFVESLVP